MVDTLEMSNLRTISTSSLHLVMWCYTTTVPAQSILSRAVSLSWDLSMVLRTRPLKPTFTRRPLVMSTEWPPCTGINLDFRAEYMLLTARSKLALAGY